MALEKDLQEFDQLEGNSRAHYAELRAMDRSIGTLRAGLRKMNVDKDTLVWFTSDNGGSPKINPTTTGGLRDFKGSLYEGGIRVPAIIEWPKKINKFRRTNYPAGAVDRLFPPLQKLQACLTPRCVNLRTDRVSFSCCKKEIGPRNRFLDFPQPGTYGDPSTMTGKSYPNCVETDGKSNFSTRPKIHPIQ